MTPDEESQFPVERLARLLVQHARQDAGLAQRTAANDDDMHSRIQALPAMQRCWEPALQLPPALGAADARSMEALEGLVSAALTSAHDAEALSREAYDASRRARRGMMAGVALSVLGLLAAGAGAMGGRLFTAPDRTAGLANQMQALSTVQHRIGDQLAALQAARGKGIKPAAATLPATSETARPANATLAPLVTVRVGVLPAHAAVQDDSTDERHEADTRALSPVSFAPSGADAGSAWSAGGWHAPGPPRYAPGYRIAMPWPAVYVIGTVRRDMRALFR